jgi:hypothetical protein
MRLKYPAMLVNPAQFSKDLFNRFVINNESERLLLCPEAKITSIFLRKS